MRKSWNFPRPNGEPQATAPLESEFFRCFRCKERTYDLQVSIFDAIFLCKGIAIPLGRKEEGLLATLLDAAIAKRPYYSCEDDDQALYRLARKIQSYNLPFAIIRHPQHRYEFRMLNI